VIPCSAPIRERCDGRGSHHWLDGELAACNLADERLTKRLRKVLGQVGGAMGQSIPFACQDWANAKAAYRFLSNDRVNEADILAGHFRSTRDRAEAAEGKRPVSHACRFAAMAGYNPA
jgi:Transposase DNA-binding